MHGLKSNTETVPLADNGGFERSSTYETFNNDVFELQNIDNEEDANTSRESTELSQNEENLHSSLPSSKLRMIRNMPNKDVLLENILVEDNADGNIESNLEVYYMNTDNMEDIREMTSTMQSKRSIRMRVQGSQRNKSRPVSGWMEFKYTSSIKFDRFKENIKEFILSFNIWNGHMKEVEGLFGTGVLSYFKFIRWLVYLNIFVSLLMVCFLMIPQFIHDGLSHQSNQSFSGLELLTGEGWFTPTKMYYGAYSKTKVNGEYNIQAAYIVVAGGYLIICLIIVAASIGDSYKNNYIIGGESVAPYSSKVFCSWDYGISNADSAKIKSMSIAQDMLESLGSSLYGQKSYSCSKLMFVVTVRIVMNILVLALMSGSIYLIIYISNEEVNFGRKEHNGNTLLPAVTISVLNMILPIAFRLIASVESYQLPKTEIEITLIRTILFKLASLVAYVVALHTEITRDRNTSNVCWETYVGQAFYKLLMMDFLFTLVTIFFGEFLRSLLAKNFTVFQAFAPGFDISRNVLDAIYSQGICWLGTFYCPLLPVVHLLKLIITFYMKKVSVVRNCRPTVRPFKASRMSVVFLILLSLMLILSMIVIGYVIMNDKKLKPSEICGPFRDTERIYDIVGDIINNDLSEVKEFFDIISSVTFIAVFFFIVSLVAYYFRMKKESNEKKIKLLKHQLSLAAQDKQFLLSKLRILLKENSQQSF